MKRICIILYFFIFSNISFSQEISPISNFSSYDYNAENQNWSITQTNQKLIYVANNKGLLEYNGSKWQLYNSPNGSILRSVKAIDNRIFSGCYMEFGYWKKNEINQLEYKSLSTSENIQLNDDEEFWNIYEYENWILFQSLDNIYFFNLKTEEFKKISSDTSIVKMYKTTNGIYFQEEKNGLFKIEDGKKYLLTNDSIILDNRIINVYENFDELIILTQDSGFYKLKENKINKWETSIDRLFKTASVYSSSKLENGGFSLGTISHGLINIDSRGNFVYQINQENGLINNTVLCVFEDNKHNIWAGLDHGISLINNNSAYKIYNDTNGNLGSVYSSIIYNGQLYLGTNQGLFYKSFNKNDKFKFIDGTQGQVWSLFIYDNTLFCGHDKGTFLLQNNKVIRKFDTSGAWTIKSTNKNEDRLLIGSYNGLYVLEKVNKKWSLKNKIKGFDISSRYFEIMGNNIYVNHEYKGLFKLDLDNQFSELIKVEKLHIKEGLKSSIVKYRNKLYYSFNEGIFSYNPVSQKFNRDSLLSNIYKNEYISGKLITNKDQSEMWAFTLSDIIKITPSKLSNENIIEKYSISNFKRKGLVGYENILKIDTSKYLLATASGYIILDVNKKITKDFEIKLNSVNQVSKDNSHLFLDKEKNIDFSNHQNNFRFDYSVPEYNFFNKTLYQYKLEGLYNQWSDWSEESTKLFENLPPNDYQFLVRAKIGHYLSNNIESYSFTINKPWYFSKIMIFIYFIGFVLFSILMHTIYTRYYKKQQLRLVEMNERKMKLSQAQNEKEIIKIRNEKLRHDFKIKSKELATSIMNIVKKNELLNSIKMQLLKMKSLDDTNTIINTIDKSLKRNDDWEFFQEAFNNADRDFLKNLKNLHPNLSPNDMKLCAYLRLNLSSKEIAPLFNISTRSLEIKRYRLRKKLNLSSKQNLTKYILDL